MVLFSNLLVGLLLVTVAKNCKSACIPMKQNHQTPLAQELSQSPLTHSNPPICKRCGQAPPPPPPPPQCKPATPSICKPSPILNPAPPSSRPSKRPPVVPPPCNTCQPPSPPPYEESEYDNFSALPPPPPPCVYCLY